MESPKLGNYMPNLMGNFKWSKINRHMPDILVVGSLNADLVVRAPRFPQPGETISGSDLQIIPGGKGANQAVAAARQGTSVSMLGRVGNDSFGPELINNLKQNHVDTSHVQIDSQSATGTAIIVVDTTAGGDAFIGGIASALLQNKSLEEAVSYGCACGALATTKFGAQPSFS